MKGINIESSFSRHTTDDYARLMESSIGMTNVITIHLYPAVKHACRKCSTASLKGANSFRIESKTPSWGVKRADVVTRAFDYTVARWEDKNEQISRPSRRTNDTYRLCAYGRQADWISLPTASRTDASTTMQKESRSKASLSVLIASTTDARRFTSYEYPA